ncbi:MAG: TetR/AcrR family transcriptional regulator [Acidimicrobiaceae bacterium]|nr:TetR/AcrR family transcriptional regulator [Acidimicrobiaceae bacterium]
MVAQPGPQWAKTIAARSTRSHGRRTLAKLLDAAVAEFSAFGWHGARMARIAKRAGTAHGTVYAYFADKDDLLEALYLEVGVEVQGAMGAMPALESGPAGFDALRSWMVEVCSGFQRHAAVARTMAEALADETDSKAGRTALRDQQRVLDVFADRVRATGVSGLDPTMAALTIYALIEGANESVQRGELLVSEEELVNGLTEFVYRSAFGAGVDVL